MVNLQGEKTSIRDSEYTVLDILDLWPYNLPAKKLSQWNGPNWLSFLADGFYGHIF